MNDRIILGENCCYDTDTEKTGLNNNVAVTGCTGSGKTMSIVNPKLLYLRHRNLCISDPKRELFPMWEATLRARGYEVLEINLKDPCESPYCFNHFDYLRNAMDIAALAEGLYYLCPQNTLSTVDVFWKKNFLSFAKFAIYYVIETKDDPTLADVCDLMDAIDLDENATVKTLSINNAVGEIMKNKPDHPMISCFKAFCDNPVKTMGNILSDFRSTLASVFNEDLKTMLRTKMRFNIDDLIARKTVIFITSGGENEGINAYVNMIFNTLIPELMRRADSFENQCLPIPTELLLDDFAGGTCIKTFPMMISKFRSKGISATIILQDENQLHSLYGENGAASVLNNCDTMVYLGGNSLETARNWSIRLSLPIDEVLYMPLNQVAVYRRGSRPVITERYRILEDEEFRKVIAMQHKEKETEKKKEAEKAG